MKIKTLINWILSVGLLCLLGFAVLYINNVNVINHVSDFLGPQQKKVKTPGFKFAIYGDSKKKVSMEYPVSVLVHEQGIYVVDQDDGNIKVFNLSGRYVDSFGNLESPYGIAEYGGNFYVSDMAKGQILIFSKSGQALGELKINNLKKSIVPGSLFVYDKHLYVSDVYQGQVLVFNLPERKLVKIIGSLGSGEGQLKYPHGMAVDKLGNLFVADSGNNRIVVFDKEGKYLKTIGGPANKVGGITTVRGVALNKEGQIYASLPLVGVVQVYEQNGELIHSIGGNGQQEGSLGLPNEIIIDSNGRLYITEIKNKRVSVFER